MIMRRRVMLFRCYLVLYVGFFLTLTVFLIPLRLRIPGIRPQHIDQQIHRIPRLPHLHQHHRQFPE